ncbi:hypothetical protein SAY87_007586 [Trapa incisa]|uniref:non-specific serine/threonine protein kinase n=1 Tax=Trapa incisa TaxID=236973 RepID=A0AAN7KIU0_9MYRT|nr:hypothetical protein SAY87_007586 [Trapa incisa]
MDFLSLAMILNYLHIVLVFLHGRASSAQKTGFTFNGFQSSKLELEGVAVITPNGLLRLTEAKENLTETASHAFYQEPIQFKRSTGGSSFSFSTMFVFAIVPLDQRYTGPGMAFVVAPQRSLPGGQPRQYLGIFNMSNNGNATNHVLAVELDTVSTPEVKDIDKNHVGIDINGVVSAISAQAAYHTEGGAGKLKNLTLKIGQAMQVWVDYDGTERRINVTLAPLEVSRPSAPLLSLAVDLTPVMKETMYVGFSSATSQFYTSHYILGWSFRVNGHAQDLDISKLPKLPRLGKMPAPKMLTIGVPLLSIFSLSILIFGLIYHYRRKMKFAEVLEEWELNYGPHRFKYKDLYIATRGFRDQELLGTGGFGRVYRGTLPTSKIDIAVKRISHDSRQGVREFIAEIVSLGRLRHRNIVTLLGYCRRKGELLLVYDYMQNGSLDKYLFYQPRITLTWSQRFRVIKGVAAGLLYLHEGWDQVVIHRDVKASNVLLDAELNGRLGDFGLARLHDHGTDLHTTHVVGTLGYLAPENTRTGKATKATDVYAFGAFLLEVATGRRPIEPKSTTDAILVDWVFSCWRRGGGILEARDPNLKGDFVVDEVELVLKLGMVCSQSEPKLRPSMRQVVQCLDGDVNIQDLCSLLNTCLNGLKFTSQEEGFDDMVMSYPSSSNQTYLASSYITESIISDGR